MIIDKQQLRTLILWADRQQLIQHLDACLEQMTTEQLDAVFGGLYYEQVIQKLSPPLVLAQLKKFLADSLAGKYYAPFETNSKNYDWVPPETDAWYSELSGWLDRSCELVEQGHGRFGKECLDICFQLIETQGDDRTIFGREIGDWMIFSKYDYKAIYRGLELSY